jgi:hypothetical protein
MTTKKNEINGLLLLYGILPSTRGDRSLDQATVVARAKQAVVNNKKSHQ